MEYKIKINKLREYMKHIGVFGLYITSAENVFYLSGFTGFGDGRLFITRDSAFIITDSRYTLQVQQQCPDFKLISSSCNNVNAITEVISSENIYVIGFENENISYKDYFNLKNCHNNIDFFEIGNYFSKARDIKNAFEAESISEACKIACKSLSEVLCFIKPGAFEKDIAIELEYRMKLNGAQEKAFETIVASGIRSALPHGAASDKKIEYKDAVTIDFGCKYNYYCSDMTRTFFVGKPCDELRKIYEIVLKAQEAALSMYKDGMTGRELDNISREIISKEGYGKCFGHSLGHGVGLEIHEGATIGPSNLNVIEKGTVFSIEPGIYVEKLGGVRIEDLVLASNNGLINFTDSFDKKMLVL